MGKDHARGENLGLVCVGYLPIPAGHPSRFRLRFVTQRTPGGTVNLLKLPGGTGMAGSGASAIELVYEQNATRGMSV
jgi:hypothetical protein